MKGTLKKESKFSEIEKWFNENIDDLPDTLDSQCAYYSNLKYTINLYLDRINNLVQKLGANGVRKSVVAKADKNNLYLIYLRLQDLENWNVGVNEIQQRYGTM